MFSTMNSALRPPVENGVLDQFFFASLRLGVKLFFGNQVTQKCASPRCLRACLISTHSSNA